MPNCKFFVLSLYLLFSISVNAQTDFQEEGNKVDAECQKGIEKASADSKDGKFKLITFGEFDKPEKKEYEFYKEYMLDKYSVTIIDGGKDERNEIKCYTNFMKFILVKRYGQDFMERSKREAHDLFKAKN